MSEPVRGVVVTHSALGQALVEAVRQISGAEPGAVTAVSNDQRGPDALQGAVAEGLGPGPGVVFTDMPSGSCAFAARRLAGDRADVAVVCGVNLPMLLDFVFHRDLPLPELVDRLVQKGKTSITGTVRESVAHADRAVSR